MNAGQRTTADLRDHYRRLLSDWLSLDVAVMLPCDGDYLGAMPAVLRRLSEGARVYSAWWDVNAHDRLSFAVGGELVLTIDALAVIDQTTGARLTSEWLEQAHSYISVRMPDAGRSVSWLCHGRLGCLV
jgi:hypothetical protein